MIWYCVLLHGTKLPTYTNLLCMLYIQETTSAQHKFTYSLSLSQLVVWVTTYSMLEITQSRHIGVQPSVTPPPTAKHTHLCLFSILWRISVNCKGKNYFLWGWWVRVTSLFLFTWNFLCSCCFKFLLALVVTKHQMSIICTMTVIRVK